MSESNQSSEFGIPLGIEKTKTTPDGSSPEAEDAAQLSKSDLKLLEGRRFMKPPTRFIEPPADQRENDKVKEVPWIKRSRTRKVVSTIAGLGILAGTGYFATKDDDAGAAADTVAVSEYSSVEYAQKDYEWLKAQQEQMIAPYENVQSTIQDLVGRIENAVSNENADTNGVTLVVDEPGGNDEICQATYVVVPEDRDRGKLGMMFNCPVDANGEPDRANVNSIWLRSSVDSIDDAGEEGPENIVSIDRRDDHWDIRVTNDGLTTEYTTQTGFEEEEPSNESPNRRRLLLTPTRLEGLTQTFNALLDHGFVGGRPDELVINTPE